MTNLEEKALQILLTGLTGGQTTYEEYRNRPLDFVSEILGMTLWSKQEEIIHSVLSNRFTVVEAGHGVGKSIDAAALVCWWLSTREEAKVVTLAPTWAQVANVLWKYIQSMAKKAKLPGSVLETPKWNITPDRFAVGLSPKRATQEDVATLQGYHSPNLLIILDEAPGVSRLLWEAIRGLAVGENNRILAIGNPIEQSGPFWDACNSENWHHIRISCLEHPNITNKKDVIPGAVSYTWVKEMLRDHCVVANPEEEFRLIDKNRSEEDKPKVLPEPDVFFFEGVWYKPDAVFEMRVLGRAPAEGSSQLIPLAWVIAAQNMEFKPSHPIVLGFDPSRYGGDASTLVARAGPKVLWIKRRYPSTNNPGVELAGWLKDEYERLEASKIYIDSIGVGATVVDQARVLGLPVVDVMGSQRAFQSTRFFNLRTENWWKVRVKLQRNELQLPPDDLLAGDLTAPRYDYEPGTGRYQLEQKEQVKARLGRSPDSGDALSLTFASPTEQSLSENPVSVLHSTTRSKWFVARRAQGSRWKKFKH